MIALTGREIEEFYQIITFIEISSLSESALGGSKALEEELEKLIDLMDATAVQEDLEKYRELNARFHHAIIRSTKNRRLRQLYCDISKMERWFQSMTLHFLRMNRSNSEHRGILSAYKDQDLSRIWSLLNEHYSHAVEILTIKGVSLP